MEFNVLSIFSSFVIFWTPPRKKRIAKDSGRTTLIFFFELLSSVGFAPSSFDREY